ncbi:MAG: hypothetical protein IJA72_02515 [Clostridia bacterium]|nr:hypothetical protein [Clostridia bacterium]
MYNYTNNDEIIYRYSMRRRNHVITIIENYSRDISYIYSNDKYMKFDGAENAANYAFSRGYIEE